jgi:restriction system protein
MSKRESSFLDEAFEAFKHAPVWVGPVFAIFAYFFFRYFVPAILPSSKPGGLDPSLLVRSLLPVLAWWIAALLLLAWVGAELWKFSNRRLFDRQTGLESIRALSWSQFESLIGEAYRRQGYLANVVGSTSNDGGVDIELTRPSELILVQCKHWRAYKVDVKTVRELLGVVTARRALAGIVVTSGYFTKAAKHFASSVPGITLIDGPLLTQLIGFDLSPSRTPVARMPASNNPLNESRQSVLCPVCNAPMIERTNQKGRNPGSKFWGCERFPSCRGTRPIA